MTVLNENFTIHTQGHTDIIDITKNVQNAVYRHSLRDAQVTVYISGSTAAITTIEYEDGLVKDLYKTFEKIAPAGDSYHHDDLWHDGNGYAHIRAALLGNSVTIPLVNSALNLGTWQQIVLIDFDNKPRLRNVTVQILC